jgi:hypothetical protein
MVVTGYKLNAYYLRPDKGCGLICGSRRIRYYRGFVLVGRKQPSAKGIANSKRRFHWETGA